ncbi:alanine--tRNA ligase [Candidatus Bathyarchaeota archaeon]|nr:MAG: alanine--tRNA ligase [Candidatus Bathyarchaeota archaeon]
MELPDGRLLAEVSRVSGLISISKTSSRAENWRRVASRIGADPQELSELIDPIVNIYAVADHTKCLTFLLAEGVVPSNVREGYLTRLLIRRTCRLLRNLSIEDRLFDIVEMQISLWSRDFPHLKELQDEILELLSIEKEKYEQTLSRGHNLVKRIIQERRSRGTAEIPLEELVELYDSHGLTPEVVSEMAEAEGVEIHIPENFYSYVAEKHMAAPEGERTPLTEGIEDVKEEFSDLPETERLYYKDAYIKEFKAKVLRVSGKRVVLDRTAFYPEGGGQPADQGYLEFNGKQSRVTDVQKVGGVIIHFLEGSVPKEGDEVTGRIDWERRISLMRNHTATHIVMGAARRILGEHVWQAGAQKGIDRSRLDISHPKRLSFQEIKEIENLANRVVMENRSVETFWLPREEAERNYGFRIYQGGVVPGREIRIVKVEDWDVEACGGTHCRLTGEIGLIKIIRTERIQDGVERLIFSVGESAVKAIQETEGRILRIAEILEVQPEKVERTVNNVVSEWRELRRERERLADRLAVYLAENYLSDAEDVAGVKVISKIVNAEEADVDLLIKVSAEIIKQERKAVSVLICIDKNARLVVNVGEEALKLGVDAREIAREAGSKLGGGGSGKPNFAQGGGTRIEGAGEALKKAKDVILRSVKE